MSRLLLHAFLIWAGPVSAAGSGSGFGDILRGMATGLAILGQSTNATNPNFSSPFGPYALPPGYAWPSMQTLPGWGGSGWTPPLGYPPYPYTRPYTGAYNGGYNGVYNRAYGGPVPPRYRESPTLDKLQGGWAVDKDEGLLLVKANMARLYAARDEYQDFYIQADTRYLWMWPIDSKVPQRYRLRFLSDRVVLDDELGYTLTLRRYKPGTTQER